MRFRWIQAVAAAVCACVFFAARAAHAAPGGGQRVISLTCRFDSPRFSAAGAGYSRVALDGCTVRQRPGEPLMPFRPLRVLLPPGMRVTGVSLHAVSPPVTLDGVWKIDYGRHPLPLRLRRTDAGRSITTPDASLYNSPGNYPASQVELVSVQHMEGYAIAVLRVYPLQYMPASGRVTFTPVLRVEIGVESDDASSAPLAGGADRRAAAHRAGTRHGVDRRASAVLPAFADNPEMLDEYSAGLPPEGLGPSSTHDYLLVTSTNLFASFQPLIAYHSAQGLSVLTASIENVVSSTNGIDAADKLRNHIRHAYTNWGVQYVLLGGDIGVVPWRGAYARCSGVTFDAMPCDLYFACLDGTWDGDGDGIYGEPDDGDGGGDVDMLAEVCVGRAPVDTPAQAARFVAKAIDAATRNQPPVTSLFVAEYLGGAAQGGDGLDPTLPAFTGSYSTVSWLDDRPNNYDTWTFVNAIAALNASPRMIAHYGHSDETTAMRLYEDDIDYLTNAPPFLFYSAGCDVGAFDNQFGPDCIGEAFVVRNSSAAYATLANTREGWYDAAQEWLYSGEFLRNFYEGLLTGGFTALAVANQASKEALIGSVETTGDMPYRWCYFGMTLLGDPAMRQEPPAGAGMPFVDITNEIAQAHTTPSFVLAGTNNAFVTGMMWISNAANGECVSFAASQSWVSAPVALPAFTNVFHVYGSNSVGNVASDTIAVIGVPEGGAAALAFLLAGGAGRRRVRSA